METGQGPEPTWDEGELHEEDVIQDSYNQGYTSMEEYVEGDNPIEEDPPGAYDDDSSM